MKDKIIQIIKEGIESEGLVLPHEGKIDQGPVIRLVMEIAFFKDPGDILDGSEGRILDDGGAVIHDPKRRGQHRTISNEA